MKSARHAVLIVAAIALLQMTEAKSDEPRKSPTPFADPMKGKAPGDVRDDNGLALKLIWCPPGVVTMESVEHVFEPASTMRDVELLNPPRTIKVTPVEVFLTKGYWIGQCEVTQSEWKQVMNTEPWKGSDLMKEGADYPAAFVSWNDAVDFCHKLTERERQAGRLPDGWEYTLPTEAEWERACRARTETRFSFGNDESKLGDYAWFTDNASAVGERYAHRVGQKKANAWGLLDMHGNVWEWCRDYYRVKLPGGRDPEVKPAEDSVSQDRVHRGGGWMDDVARCQSAFRNRGSPGLRSPTRGFRIALSVVR